MIDARVQELWDIERLKLDHERNALEAAARKNAEAREANLSILDVLVFVAARSLGSKWPHDQLQERTIHILSLGPALAQLIFL